MKNKKKYKIKIYHTVKKIKKFFRGSAFYWSVVAWGSPPSNTTLHKYSICKYFTIQSKKVRKKFGVVKNFVIYALFIYNIYC